MSDKTIRVDVTAEDIAEGFEACIEAGPTTRAKVCPLARALQRAGQPAVVLAFSWHHERPKGQPATPGAVLPPDARAFVKAVDEKIAEEREARTREATGGTPDRPLPMPEPATFTLRVPL